MNSEESIRKYNTDALRKVLSDIRNGNNGWNGFFSDLAREWMKTRADRERKEEQKWQDRNPWSRPADPHFRQRMFEIILKKAES